MSSLTTSTQSNLQENRHALDDGERCVEQRLLAAIGQHFASFDGTQREAYDALIEQTPIAADVTFENVNDADVRGCWTRPNGAPVDRAILFLHGGAYMLGSAQAYRGFASQIALRSGVAAFVLDYPLAPEYPFPAAHDAVTRARCWLHEQGIGQVAIVGDSAGGGLALAALSHGVDLPSAVASAVVFSPWVDLSLSGSSMTDPTQLDPIFKPSILRNAAMMYLDGADSRDGRASPLYDIPAVLPPLAVQVGADELLLDDATRYARAAAQKGGTVQLDIFEGLHHVFQQSTQELPSARAALDAAAAFISQHWLEI